MPGEGTVNPKLKTRSVGLLVIAIFILLILPFIFHDTHPAVDEPKPSVQARPLTQLAEPAASPATVFPLSTPAVSLAQQEETPAPAVPSLPKTRPNPAPVPVAPVALQQIKREATLPKAKTPSQAISSANTPPAPRPAAIKSPVHKPARSAQAAAPRSAPSAPATTATTAEVFWTVQLLSLRSEPSAAKWATRLREAGYDAYYRRVEATGGQVRYRVFSGPVLTKTRAQQRQAEMKTQFHLTGLVRVYRKP